MKLGYVLLRRALVAALAGCAMIPEARADDAFTFVTIGNTRSDDRFVQPQAFLDHIKEMNKLKPQPAFIVITGSMILGHTEDRELVLKEWDEFDRATAAIRAPVRLVPGGHDIWSEQSYEVFKDRYGPSYYAFDQGNSHFIILSSEEPAEDEHGKIAGSQLQWLAEDIEANKEAEHIFVFVHRPLWGSLLGTSESGWDDNVHPILVKYGVDIVFGGHDHRFMNYGVVDGVQYYMTGGGGSQTDGVGGFHHFVVTTVAGAKVSSVLIDSAGEVFPHDVVTLQTPEVYSVMLQALTFSRLELPKDGNQTTLAATLEHPFSNTVEIRYEWDTRGTKWHVEPAKGRIRIGPGEEATMKAMATFDRERPIPTPYLQGTLVLDGQKIAEIQTPRLQVRMFRHATVARLAESPVVDGVVSEGEYGKAKLNSGFVDYRGRGYAEQQSRFLLGYDDKALYIAVIADEPNPDGIVLRPRQWDGNVWQDDDIEVFIDATFDRKTYHQFAVNLGSAQLDGIGGPKHGTYGDVSWNSNWRAKSRIGPDKYVIEIAIPHKVFGVSPPKPGTKWGLNICRQRQAPVDRGAPEMSAWSPTYAHYHMPSYFGTITFE